MFQNKGAKLNLTAPNKTGGKSPGATTTAMAAAIRKRAKMVQMGQGTDSNESAEREVKMGGGYGRHGSGS